MIPLVRKHWMVLQAGLVVLWVRLLLRYKRLPQILDRLSHCSRKRTPDADVMRFMAYYVDRWLQLFPYNKRGNCFPRSLALFRFARQVGYPVMFHCGVRKDLLGLDGHAWLMLNGQAFHESGAHWQGFAITYSYPSGLIQTVSQGSGTRCDCFGTMVP